jgi:O-antigen/teichoic acid export membrane protein
MSVLQKLKKLNLQSDLVQSALAFLVKIGAGVASYLLFVFAARLMGAEQFGVFSALFSIVMLTGIVGGFGQQVFLVKEIPHAEEGSNDGRKRGVYVFSALATLAAAALCAMVFAFIAPHLAQGVTFGVLIAGAVLSFLYSLSQTTIGGLRVQNATITAIATRDFLWRVLVIVAMLASAFFLVDGKLSSAAVLGIMAGTLALILLLHLVLIGRHVLPSLRGGKPSYAFKRWFESSCGLALIALISSADLYLYTIILGKTLSPEETGAFFAALKTVELINLFLMAVTLIISTDISRLVAKGNAEELQTKCNMAILLQAIPALGASLFIVVLAPFLLSFFAPEYTEHTGLLRLLVLGMLVNALTGATVLMMQLGGMHWRQLVFQGGGLGLSALALPFLTEMMGVSGAAVAFILYKLGWNFLAVLAIRNKLGVDPSIAGLFFRNKEGMKPLFAMLVASARERI